MSLLRSIFGPSKDEIWSQISNDIGGEFIDGGFWGKDVLVYKHGQWQILLDTYTVSSSTGNTTTTTTYTRMRAPFVNKGSLLSCSWYKTNSPFSHLYIFDLITVF